MTSPSSSPFDWALRYARLGWPVLPVGPDKRPLGGNGLRSATTEEKTIRSWWTQWPEAEVGVACKPSGLVVVDLDVGHADGADGIASFEGLADGRPDEAALVASTPAGGRHLFYRGDDDEIASRTKIAPGVDIKSGGGEFGGYVIAPSGRPGREWVEGSPGESQLAPLPSWLAELLSTRSGPSLNFTTSASREDCDVWSALFTIPPSIGRSHWIRVIYAVHAALDADPSGAELVEFWSSRTLVTDQYRRGEATEIYSRATDPDHFAGDRPITQNTLHAMAREFAATRVLGSTQPSDDSNEFPLWSFPRVCRVIVEEGAVAHGVHPAFWAVPLLGILAGAIGATRRARIKPGWSEPCVLWMGVVAGSGAGKSPPLRVLKRPLVRHDERLHKITVEAEREFEVAIERWRGAVHKANQSGLKPPPKPTPPPMLAATVDDVTLEALLARLEDNPRGLLLLNDELAAWLRAFNRYRSGGGDEQTWLSIHSGDSAKVDRKGGPGKTKRIVIPRAIVSVVGTIQPSVAKTYIGSSENVGSGLAARLHLARPPVVAARWTYATVSDELVAEYEAIIAQLLKLELEDDEPIDLPLTDEAQTHFVQFFDEVSVSLDRLGLLNDEAMSAVLSKLRAAAARFGLALALARAAESGEAAALRTLDLEAISGGIALARYFEAEAVRLYSEWQEQPGDADSRNGRRALDNAELRRQILASLRRRDLTRSEIRDLFHRNVSSERLGKALEALKRGKLVASRIEAPTGAGRPREIWCLIRKEGQR